MDTERLFPPAEIYHYCNVSTARLILKNCSLKFSKPIDVNDPLDCHPEIIDYKPSPTEVYDLVEKTKFSRTEKRIKLIEYLKTPEIISDVLTRLVDEFRHKCGICCFSEVYDEPNLWAHYGDKSTGICLKFNSRIDITEVLPGKVLYRNRAEKYIWFKDKEQCFIDLFFTKTEEWSHEREVRFLKLNGNGIYDFDPSLLLEVIFGERVPQNVIKSIIDECESNQLFHLKFQKLIRSGMELKLVSA